MKKIVILGCPSSGKTTLANKLGPLLNIPVHHLDKIFWVQKGGIKQDIFLAQQEEIMRAEKWIIDGGFTKSTSYDVRLKNADTIILFTFSKTVIYWRLIKRFVKYFNKPRPDGGRTKKFHIDWHLIKLIWNYPATAEYVKILEYSKTKNVIILHTLKEEKLFLKKLKP